MFSGIFGGSPFRDRRDAGRKLAGRLLAHRDENPVVFGLPRGGVPVAYEVALALGAPLGVIFARKIGAPGQPELGIGAVAQGGKRVLNARILERLGIPDEYIEQATRREIEEIEAAKRRFEVDENPPEARRKTAILVDDGLATGATARAAVLAARDMEPERIVLAAPVCAPRTSRSLRDEVDEVICLETPRDLSAIGFWYKDFDQTTDEEVVELLAAARKRTP